MTREEFIRRCLDAKIVGTQLLDNQYRYLMMRHFGVRDDEFVFDKEHGVMYSQAASDRIGDKQGSYAAPDVERWTCYDVVDGKAVPHVVDGEGRSQAVGHR
jgi:hypothetical protein